MLYRLFVLGLGLSLVISACGDGGSPAGADDDGNLDEDDDNSTAEDEDDSLDEEGNECLSADELFAKNVQPNLSACRVCHVPGGLAAEAKPPVRFMLSSDKSEDLANIKSAWTAMGGNNPVSRILVKAAGGADHSGGALWAPTSGAYKSMANLLKSMGGDAMACEGEDDGESPNDYPLLGSSHGGSPLLDFCGTASDPNRKSDSTKLPPDPRSLVVPGANEGKAVYYNAFWVNCHADPELVGEKPQPTTCGELRKRVAAGARLMKRDDYATGSSALFSGDNPFGDLAAGFGAASLSSEGFNNLWQAWGLTERPDNFDELVSNRYGSPFGQQPNPYPLPGEDPNLTNGGTGTLPISFVQLKTSDDKWSGRIGLTCHSCHSGAAGDKDDGLNGVIYGGGSSLQDLNLFLVDGLQVGFIPSLVYFLNLTQGRGRSNASVINVAFLFQEEYDLTTLPGVLLSGSTGDMDTPAIWNLGHKTKKFIDGVFAADATRVDLVFYEPFLGLFGSLGKAISSSAQKAQDWVKQHSQDANHWFEAQKAPVYPGEIDIELAEAGAVLFHSKNLWARGLDNPAPQPEGGNGSCAGCHGAYSPRFLHDPEYIDTPALEGVASFIVPKKIIRTDPVRTDTNNVAVQRAGQRNFFGYPETVGTENDCGPQNLDGSREPGYYAQPLYGIWATAPYFHNGSVPNLWEVLKASDRKTFWRRLSKPARADQEGQVTMGFDYNLARAYDSKKVGWKYQTLKCRVEDGLVPGEDCDPENPTEPTSAQRNHAALSRLILGMWNLLGSPPATPEDVEARKIVNTLDYGMGNGGHDFTNVLTDAERKAIIEYLKTL